MGEVDKAPIIFAVLVIVVLMAFLEYIWRRARKDHFAAQVEEWRQTQVSIRATLAQGNHTQVVQDAWLRGIANQAQLDQICESTATALGAPAAVITVVEHEGQRWLAYYGAEWCDQDAKAGLIKPLETSYCQYVVATDHTLVITDSFTDVRVQPNTGEVRTAVRAYIGAPVHTAAGLVVGSLCVFDNRPRKWSTRDRATVESFASLVSL